MNSFKGRSLQSFFLLRFLSLLTLSIVIVTVWSILGNWIGASYAGRQWASAFTTHFKTEVNELQQETEFAEIAIEHALEHKQKPDLPANYAVARAKPDGSYEYIVGKLNAEQDSKDLAAIETNGLYRIGNNIVFVRKMKGQGVGKNALPLLVLRVLRHGFSDRLANGLGAEASIFVDGPTPSIISSSWKNIRGERVVPQIPASVWSEVSKLRNDQLFEGTAEYKVQDYQGLYLHSQSEPAFHRGETDFRVFHAFTPIYDTTNTRIGYFSIVVPEDVLLLGVKKWMWISLLF